MTQVITIDTKTANSLIEAILELKSEVSFLRQKIAPAGDSLEISTNTAINNLKNGDIVEFADIDKAIKYLHS